MTNKEFRENLKGFKVVNEFKNEHGEAYIILKSSFSAMKGYYIAGDETDWEILSLHRSGKFAYTEFMFSSKEAATIKKVMDLLEGTK